MTTSRSVQISVSVNKCFVFDVGVVSFIRASVRVVFFLSLGLGLLFCLFEELS